MSTTNAGCDKHETWKRGDIRCPWCRAARLEGELDEIKGVVGYPGSIALREHGLSDSLPDVVRYTHREWLRQTHSAEQRVLQEQGISDRLRADLADARAELAKLQAVVDAAIVWDASLFNPQRWFQKEKDLHDAIAGLRGKRLDGEPVVSRSVERRLKIQLGGRKE